MKDEYCIHSHQETPNWGLPLWCGNDPINLPDDHNNFALKLDCVLSKKIHAIEDKMNALVTSIDEKMQALELLATNLNTAYTDLTTQVGGLRDDLAELTEYVESIEPMINIMTQGEKISGFVGAEFVIASSSTGVSGVTIPFVADTGSTERIALNANTNHFTVDNTQGETPLLISVCAQVSATFTDDGKGISGGIHRYPNGGSSFEDVAQAQVETYANDENYPTLQILPCIVSIPAGNKDEFDLSCRCLGPDASHGTMTIPNSKTRSYMTITII